MVCSSNKRSTVRRQELLVLLVDHIRDLLRPQFSHSLADHLVSRTAKVGFTRLIDQNEFPGCGRLSR